MSINYGGGGFRTPGPSWLRHCIIHFETRPGYVTDIIRHFETRYFFFSLKITAKAESTYLFQFVSPYYYYHRK